MDTLLRAEGIIKFYGLRPVLRGASLSVGRGEIVALIGPNGSGKSTFLRVASTLARPDGGALDICGIDAVTHGDRARTHIGMVGHQPMLYPDLTARENLEFHARLYGLYDWQPRVAQALELVKLGARGGDPVRTFSRGMIQRLSIARVLMQNAEVVLLDEPFTGLDAASAKALSAVLAELAGRGRAVIMTTHENRGREGVTRVVELADGAFRAGAA